MSISAPKPEFPDLNTSTRMADALFSGTRQKLLGLLFGQPGCVYSLSELIRLSRAGSGAVQREMVRLADSGLVLVQTQGRFKNYRANPESPIFDELCPISRKILGPGESIAKAAGACSGSDYIVADLGDGDSNESACMSQLPMNQCF